MALRLSELEVNLLIYFTNGKRIMKTLVVDDDRVLSDGVAFTLRREGFHIIRAFEGEVAQQQ